jgi:hypothetical protein
VVQVADIPDESEAAFGAEDAVDLREGLRRVEPVEGLGDGHGVGDRVGEAGLLGGAFAGVGIRGGAAERVAHLFNGLDRDDCGAGRRQEAGELAGAGGEVDKGGFGAKLELGAEPLDRLGGVAGPALLVDAGRRGEPTAGCVVNGHATEACRMRGSQVDDAGSFPRSPLNPGPA